MVSGLVIELTPRMIVACVTCWWRFMAIMGTPSNPYSLI